MCIYYNSIARVASLAPKLRSFFAAKYLQLRTAAASVNSVVMLPTTLTKQCLYLVCTPKQLCASCSGPAAPQKTTERGTDFALAARFELFCCYDALLRRVACAGSAATMHWFCCYTMRCCYDALLAYSELTSQTCLQGKRATRQ